MATERDGRFRVTHPSGGILGARTVAAAKPARVKVPALVIANSHDIASVGLEALLVRAGHTVLARCTGEDELLRCTESCCPDIIVLAENVAKEGAAKTVCQLRARNCSVAIILLLDQHDAIRTSDLLDLKVEAILLSAARAKTLLNCVQNVWQGHKWLDPNLLSHLAMSEARSETANCLTSREAEIAEFISRGLRNKEVARELHLSEGTVKIHLHHIYQKLHVGSRTQLAISRPAACEDMDALSRILQSRPGGDEDSARNARQAFHRASRNVM
jgi:DNA-binding NarL/FixJ family response regulator